MVFQVRFKLLTLAIVAFAVAVAAPAMAQTTTTDATSGYTTTTPTTPTTPSTTRTVTDTVEQGVSPSDPMAAAARTPPRSPTPAARRGSCSAPAACSRSERLCCSLVRGARAAAGDGTGLSR